MRFAVMASGFGSNLQAIINARRRGSLSAELVLVFSDKPDANALVRARRAGIPVAHLSPREYASRHAYDEGCVDLLKKQHIDLVVLAGYMRILSPVFIRAFAGKIINIHPALLPAFKGAHAIKDAYDYGVKVTGVTVHLVDEEVDHGPVIRQAAVRIHPEDTLDSLTRRVHRLEHRIYPEVIEALVRGRIVIDGRRAIVKG